MKMAQAHFDEVEVKDNEYYAILLLHLNVVVIFYSYFILGLVEKGCKKHCENALNNQYCKNHYADFIHHRYSQMMN